jgi:hypothetical protein
LSKASTRPSNCAVHFYGRPSARSGEPMMAYGVDPVKNWRQGAALIAKVLRGAKPAELPAELPTKFELLINQKTARSRTRVHRTAAGPMPVMISRSGRCPCRTSRWWPSSVSLSAWTLSKAATSASTACASSARAVAQHLGQRVRKSSWLGELENVSVGHGVSLLRWRSGGVEHPHDTPPYPLMPSPTFAHSSRSRC